MVYAPNRLHIGRIAYFVWAYPPNSKCTARRPVHVHGFPIVFAKFWGLRSAEGSVQRGDLSFSQELLPLTSYETLFIETAI